MLTTLLARRNLRAHRLRSTLSALAVALAVAMLLAVLLIALAAGDHTAELEAAGASRVDLELFGADGAPFDAAAVALIRGAPEVAHAAPSLAVEARVGGVSLLLRGVEPASYRDFVDPGVDLGRLDDEPALLAPALVAVREGWRVGRELTAQAGERAVAVVVAGRLPAEAGPPAAQPEALIPLPLAQELAGAPGRVGLVQVRLRDGLDVAAARDGLAARLGAGVVVARSSLDEGPPINIIGLRLMLGMVGLIVLLAAAFVIANAFGMGITARTRELGALRTLGTTRGQIVAVVLAEAGLIGLAGAALGVPLGLALVWGAFSALRIGAPPAAAWWALVAAPLLGLLMALLAGLPPALRAARVAPIAALRSEPSAARHARPPLLAPLAALAALLVGVGVTSAGVRPDLASAVLLLLPAMALLLGCIVWLMPGLVAPLGALATRPLERLLGAGGRLAADNLRRNPNRAALTAGAMTAGLTLLIALGGLTTALFKAGLTTFAALIREDRLISFDITDLEQMRWDNAMQAFIDAEPLDPELRARLQALADRSLIDLQLFDPSGVPPLLSPNTGSPAIFVEPEIYIRSGSFRFVEGDPEEALALLRRGQALLLQPATAARLGVGVGDTVTVPTLRGDVPFTVAGIGGNWFVMTVVPYADGQRFFGVGEPSMASVYVRPGADRDAVLAEVDRIVADYPGLIALDGRQGADVFVPLIDQLVTLLNAMLLVAVVVATLGVLNTMAANVAERTREIGMLRALGATRRQIRQAVVAEGAILGLLAVVAATLASVAIVTAYLLIVSPNTVQSLGVELTDASLATMRQALATMGATALLALVVAPLAAGLAAYLPARAAAAMEVIVATRSERVALEAEAARPEGDAERRPPRSLALLLATRNLDQHRARAAMTTLAVAFGAVMMVGGDVLSSAVIGVINQSEDLRAVGEGIWSQLIPLLRGIAVGISLVAGFLIFNTFAMSVTQRRQQIGSLRALGMTRGQVLRAVLLEALLIGAAGTAIGVALGPLFAQGVIVLMRALPGSVLNSFRPAPPSAASVGMAVLLGLGVTMLAALLPARAAARLSPLAALKAPESSGLGRAPLRSTAGGAVLLLSISGWLLAAPPAAWAKPPLAEMLSAALVALWIVGVGLLLPGMVDGLGRALATSLARLWGVAGRLAADNLRRGRARVLLTVSTLAISLTLIGGLTGYVGFWATELYGPKLRALLDPGRWNITAFEMERGLAAYDDIGSIRIAPEAIADLRAVVAGRADVVEIGFAIVPELSFLGNSYFTFLFHNDSLQRTGSDFFEFEQGSWETAGPIMARGCGALVAPAVASRNGAGLGDTITVTGKRGPVACTIAGIGSPYVGASLIGGAGVTAIDAGEPFVAYAAARRGVDLAALEADLRAAAADHDLHLISVDRATRLQLQVLDSVPAMLNAFLLLAVLVAALGVANTTMLSVTERRHELGQLRALGATRAEVRAIVVGEAALIGLIGALAGLVASAGLTVILATVLGASGIGLSNYQPWAAALRSLPKVLLSGGIGLLAAPLVCAAAAYLPTRELLRGPAIATLRSPAPPAVSRRAVAHLLSRGSVRARFVLGTGLLMLAVLAGLIEAVAGHAGAYMEARLRENAEAVAAWDAALLELAIPADATTLDLDALLAGGGLDTAALLRARGPLDRLTDNGLEEFALVDRDNLVVMAFNQRQIGQELGPLADESGPGSVVTPHPAGGAPRVFAAAPVRNADGNLIGSVRLTVRLASLEELIVRLRGALWLYGALVLALGLAASWWLSAPFARAAGQLHAGAARVARGEFAPLPPPRRRRWDLSIRTRLTALMVGLMALLIGGVGLMSIPIQREQVERTTRDQMLAGVGLIAELISAGLPERLPPGDPLDLGRAVEIAGRLDLGQLQELVDRSRSEFIAYVTLSDSEGYVLASDRLSLVGERVPTAARPELREGEWRDGPVWIVSAPLLRGSGGPQIGTLSIGVSRAPVERFLAESRTLLQLFGLIALLAGVLLAQALGGAAASPVEALAAGTRRVAGGDLLVRFEAGGRDELAQLGAAFNQMVAGLRERERLRDLFGKYVSREVREAVLSGRVSLASERRTITCLYCDMRGSTGFAERYQPEEVMAALNAYFAVIIRATEAEGGIVNRFVGDEAVCIFGAPTPYADHAERGVRAALAIRAGFVELERRRAAQGLPTPQFGIGLNSGLVAAGATGSEERQEYTVIGDAMNVGARIQGLTKQFAAYDVLLSEFTVAALGARAALYGPADLGPVEIRGKQAPVRIYGLCLDGQPAHTTKEHPDAGLAGEQRP